MRILCVCDQGCNRSVHIAHLLKFRGHDTIPVGVQTASAGTIDMLAGWADLIILTDEAQRDQLPNVSVPVWVWPVEDGYRRPFNPVQHRQILRHVDDHREQLIQLQEAG